ncbi:hypothetical protein CN238_18950 [Sinorhizobium meliloti]|nr:hypothetical protein CN238_18950 [Sinorhizobium meliloti]RVH26381.1 hypothetical protein CN214_21660 [Sinorhizobium meliloti]
MPPANASATRWRKSRERGRAIIAGLLTSNDLESQSQQKGNPSAIQLKADRLQAEGQINRLKTIKRAIYGRAGPELLRARVLPLDQNRHHTK